MREHSSVCESFNETEESLNEKEVSLNETDCLTAVALALKILRCHFTFDSPTILSGSVRTKNKIGRLFTWPPEFERGFLL